ncbi:MAG: nicotinate-nucleotide adenylyltransferase [Chloroflexi bacterium]|nr:nicotinate-nucleotide adenylyltransferase [Chloroflexota bacterium]
MTSARSTLGQRQLEAAPSHPPRGRTGVFGGTFDPPHIGHLWLSALAAESVELDRVLFMPASQPPHKRLRGTTGAADRLLMTRLAIEGDPILELTAIEMEREGPSYTVDSIAELERLYGEGERLFLIMAADSLAEVETWRDPHRLLERTEWVVGPRAGTALPDSAALETRFGAAASRIHLLSGPSLDVSSSEIRRRVAAGKTIRYLVPRRVEELIVARGLYRRH